MQPFLDRLVGESPLAGVLVPLTVHNGFFGGNVDVTGLLCGCDIAAAIAAARADAAAGASTADGALDAPALCDLFVIPRVVLNDDLVTLDDMTVEEIGKAAGVQVSVVSCNPLDYLLELIELAAQADER